MTIRAFHSPIYDVNMMANQWHLITAQESSDAQRDMDVFKITVLVDTEVHAFDNSSHLSVIDVKKHQKALS